MLGLHGGNALQDLGEIYIVILIIRALLSWFPYSHDSPLNPVRRVVFTLTEPVLAPFRRIIPPVGMIDISFIVAIIVVQLVVNEVFSRIPV